MKKPDRFEYMLERAGILQFDDAYLHKAIVGLLRRNHNAYVRLVKQLGSWKTADDSVWVNKIQVLAAFEAYRKGKP
jgi:hypothetical protein